MRSLEGFNWPSSQIQQHSEGEGDLQLSPQQHNTERWETRTISATKAGASVLQERGSAPFVHLTTQSDGNKGTKQQPTDGLTGKACKAPARAQQLARRQAIERESAILIGGEFCFACAFHSDRNRNFRDQNTKTKTESVV